LIESEKGGDRREICWLTTRIRQSYGNHVFATDSLDPSVDVDLQSLFVPFKKQTFKTLFRFVLAAVEDFYRKPSEGLEVPLRGQLFSYARTADFQNIGLLQQGGSLECVSEHTTETSAVIETDVTAAAVTNLHLKRHGAEMRMQLD